MVLTSSRTDGWAQLITVLLIFVVVLALTAITTNYIAKVQKQSGMSGNVEVLETVRISNTKYIQLVRIGETYVGMAVCKDTVTKLCEIPKEQLKESISGAKETSSFREILQTIMHKETKE